MANQMTAGPEGLAPLGAQDRPLSGNPARGRKQDNRKSKHRTIGQPAAPAPVAAGTRGPGPAGRTVGAGNVHGLRREGDRK